MDANMFDAFVDSLVTTSDEARALSRDLQEKGQDDLAALWARFAEFLVVSEDYLGPPASA
ncbi:MAG: hypothetical protein JWN07_2142 [Hyphomicrobiales bacterium]|nr:hypothetical protein [Hyphomicrobiales bacterium]